jgi:hypothetical protein
MGGIGSGRKPLNLVGMTFNRLTVESFFGKDCRGEYIWNCLCICGNVRKVRSSDLRSGHNKSCGCFNRDRFRRCRIRPGAAFRHVRDTYKRSALKKGFVWELTDEQFESIITKPCYYTGRPPSKQFVARSGEVFTYSGIDRKDSKKGYTLDNCVPCCTEVNYTKLDTPYDTFLQMVKEIAQWKRL